MLDKTRDKKAHRSLQAAISDARTALISEQQEDGHWTYQLEADCTIPAEYILMNHFADTIDDELESKIAVYLREHQADHGGWPLFYGGDFDLSCSVKSYYALKMAGDDPHDEHMVKARDAILQHGGAAHANVFTRILMAMFEQVPWRATPFIPAEVILLPKWFPFHIDKVSYWSRTVMVPLFVLCTLKAKAANPRAIDIRDSLGSVFRQAVEFARSAWVRLLLERADEGDHVADVVVAERWVRCHQRRPAKGRSALADHVPQVCVGSGAVRAIGVELEVRLREIARRRLQHGADGSVALAPRAMARNAQRGEGRLTGFYVPLCARDSRDHQAEGGCPECEQQSVAVHVFSPLLHRFPRRSLGVAQVVESLADFRSGGDPWRGPGAAETSESGPWGQTFCGFQVRSHSRSSRTPTPVAPFG